MSVAVRKRHLVTLDEFLALRPDDDERYELIDGEVVAQAHARPAHSTLQGTLAFQIRSSLGDSPCRVMTEAGIRPHFDPYHNYRVSDLAVTCEPFDPDLPYTLAPVLLVEILSPADEAKQRGKLHVYSAMPSVREILFLDSQSIRAELHRRDAEGLWPEGPEVLIGDEPLRLETVGLELPLAVLYRGLALPVGERTV